ncbi:bridging integrator 3 isoform X1 [Mastacembelus armatus]|uniref:Bridging integrator 3 n=1 Tax=Mastacembelus armatus TaxID=205130 RepID=A0A3Q3LXD8_9TELE|nr:bridging integrator 3 isoform X1 [Mastacembelus armatus]
MSWIPFKIGQPKKQIVSKTVERDFEREYDKLQKLEDQTKKLHKDMKKSTEADLAMSKAAVKISADLLSNPLCEQDQAFLETMTVLDTAMRRMDSFNQEKVNQIQKTVIDPLKKYSGVFPSLNMAVKRREQALQDYKRLQSKVEKYEEKEKTGPVMVKLHQAREELRPVREDFEAKNKQLLEEMPKFYYSRMDYFQPSFEALIRAQIGREKQGHYPLKCCVFGALLELFDICGLPLLPSNHLSLMVRDQQLQACVVYFTEMYKIFSELTDQIDQAGLTDDQRERETEAKLSELRALSIVADD